MLYCRYITARQPYKTLQFYKSNISWQDLDFVRCYSSAHIIIKDWSICFRLWSRANYTNSPFVLKDQDCTYYNPTPGRDKIFYYTFVYLCRISIKRKGHEVNSKVNSIFWSCSWKCNWAIISEVRWLIQAVQHKNHSDHFPLLLPAPLQVQNTSFYWNYTV